jgi:prepilin-type processing-associated H-X9-DG protein
MKSGKTRRNAAPAFSLAELLVGVAVLSALTVLILPALSDAEANMRTLRCMNNLKQWGIGFQLYAADWKGYLPAEGDATTAGTICPGCWANAIPPYLKQPSYVYLKYTNPPTGTFAGKVLPNLIWICPEKNLRHARSNSGLNSFFYAMNDLLDGGDTGTLSGNRVPRAKLTSIPVPGQTVLLFDVYSAATPYGDATEYTPYYTSPYQDLHGNGCNFLFCDGHVAWFPTSAYFNGSSGITNYPGLRWWQ